jgi:hypothetical protein
MRIPKDRINAARSWSGVLILAIVCSLTSSLATRYWTHHTSGVSAVKSIERLSLQPKHQHLDCDAAQWVAPTSKFQGLIPNALHSPAREAVVFLHDHLFDESPYNKPPPPSA